MPDTYDLNAFECLILRTELSSACLLTDGALTSLPFFFVPGIAATVAPLGAQTVNITNERARLLDEVEDAKESAFDFYVFMRNAYVQRRAALVEDREEMPEELEEDLYTIDVAP